MDHQLLRESYQNLVQDWDHPIDQAEAFEKMKLERGCRSYCQDDHHLWYKDARMFYHVKGVAVDCPDQLQHFPPRPKRAHRDSGSGMQAVFLSAPHPCSLSTSGSTGTGVFLPPGTGNAMEPTKKSGCLTVLLPDGVIQALKLHFDRMERQRHFHPWKCSCCSGFPSWNDTMANNGIITSTPDRKDNFGRQPLVGSWNWTRDFPRSGFTDGSNQESSRRNSQMKGIKDRDRSCVQK